MSKKFILLYWPPAVWKFTIWKEIVKKDNSYQLVHNHITFDIAAQIYETFTVEFLKLNKELRNCVLQSLINEGSKNIILTLCYAKNHDDEFIENLIWKLQKNNFLVYLIQLQTELDVLSNRINNNWRKLYGKVQDIDTLKKAFNDFDIISPIKIDMIWPSWLYVNTWNQSAQKTAQIVLDFINKWD